MANGFKKAQRTAAKIKISIQGASGSGKTYSALNIATALVALTDPGKEIALIDTEKSASLYSPPFSFDVDDDFGEGMKATYAPEKLVEKLEAARKAGIYGAVIVDSMTHFWKEQGGFTKMIDNICEAQRARGQKGDSFAAWKTVDPLYRKLMTYLRNYPLHVILCIRAKQSYERSEGAGGKGSLKKVGMEPEFREGFEFEMDAQFAIDADHTAVPLKHRLGSYLDGKVFKNPGADLAEALADWIAGGAPGQEVPLVGNKPAETPTVAVETPAEVVKAPVSETKLAEVEEPAPPTDATPPADVDYITFFTDKINAGTTEDELKKDIANEIKAALKDKKITPEDYNGKLSPIYSAKMKELKAKVAA